MMRRGASRGRADAVVLGEMNLVSALGRAGISSLIVEDREHSARFSRFVVDNIELPHLPAESEVLLGRLIEYGERQAVPPVLYYAAPQELLFTSRNRDALREHFRFVIADAKLIEEIEDKAKFAKLAERYALPVPLSHEIKAGQPVAAAEIDLPFPLIMKPVTRGSSMHWLAGLDTRKAIMVHAKDHLAGLLARAQQAGVDVVVQQFIDGPESRIESYHVYVDTEGVVVGEFTGRKIRTWPPQYGHSTALETTDAYDVRDLGRFIVKKLRLTGVAKLDFKRNNDGTLHLLEVNPRFSLWHNLGAVAGVNLPQLIWADLHELPRPVGPVTATPGVVWCHPLDFFAARRGQIGTLEWIRFFRSAAARSSVSFHDPKLTAAYLAKGVARARGYLRPGAKA